MMQLISEALSQAIFLTVVFSAVALVPSLLLGLLVSVFQAATQISEQTLSFLPKVMVVPLSLYCFRNYLGAAFSDFIDLAFRLVQTSGG